MNGVAGRSLSFSHEVFIAPPCDNPGGLKVRLHTPKQLDGFLHMHRDSVHKRGDPDDAALASGVIFSLPRTHAATQPYTPELVFYCRVRLTKLFHSSWISSLHRGAMTPIWVHNPVRVPSHANHDHRRALGSTYCVWRWK